MCGTQSTLQALSAWTVGENDPLYVGSQQLWELRPKTHNLKLSPPKLIESLLPQMSWGKKSSVPLFRTAMGSLKTHQGILTTVSYAVWTKTTIWAPVTAVGTTLYLGTTAVQPPHLSCSHPVPGTRAPRTCGCSWLDGGFHTNPQILSATNIISRSYKREEEKNTSMFHIKEKASYELFIGWRLVDDPHTKAFPWIHFFFLR